jgi:O-antigen ligase
MLWPNYLKVGQSMIFRVVLTLVLLAPLPLASVHSWAWGLIASITALLVFAWGIGMLWSREAPAVGLHTAWPFLIPFLLVVGWISLQATSMTPAAWHHPLWEDADGPLGTVVGGSISLDPFETRSALARLLAYAGIFWLSLQYCRSAAHARQVILVLAIAGLAYAAYGLAVEFTGGDMALWYFRGANSDRVTSTFINYNSYATYAGLGLVCATGLLVALLFDAAGSHLSSKERLRAVLEAIAGWGSLLPVAWVVIATALLLTGSRGGLASTALGLVALLAAFGATPAARFRQVAALASVVAIAGVALFVYSGDRTAQRMAEFELEDEWRFNIYELTVEAIGDAPWLGTGYGTFEDTFRIYRDERIHGTIAMAHSTYLENALELGLPAAGLLFLTIAALFGRCLIGVRVRRRNAIYPCIGVGATVLIAAHSTVDFSLQIPAVAATYALLMGAAVAQSWGSAEKL